MKAFTVKEIHLVSLFLLLLSCLLMQQSAMASPFGVGVFGEDVPFGSATSIAISLGSAPNMTLMSSGQNFSGNASQTVTVASTDVIGYDLYIKGTSSTSMVNGSYSIAASGNSSPAALSVNSWGYNTTGSTTNFKGMTLSDASINSRTGPFTDGDVTTVTYGALIDITKGDGTYTVGVTYTAVGQT